MKPTLQEQIGWLEQHLSWLEDGPKVAGKAPEMYRALISTLRAVEQAEKELPEEPTRAFNVALCPATTPCSDCKEIYEYIDALRAYAVAAKVREND